VGPYDVLRKLGEGGMGEVFLARDSRLGRQVALKRLLPSKTGQDENRRLLREARAVAHINHPNIAAVYDVLETGERPHIVMEYVEGESLAQRLMEGPVPLPEVLSIGLQLADALVAAHAAGVVHRDLKPANVLMKGDRVKVLDFGLATMPAAPTSTDGPTAERISESFSVNPLAGTPAYMAPEQFLGRPLDERTDLYSLGVILFELLTGRRPYAGSDAVSLGLAVLTERPPKASDLNPEVPSSVSYLVGRAMSRDPEDRFESALAFRREFSRAAEELGQEPTLTAPIRWWLLDRFGPSRPRWVLAAAGAAGLALGVLIMMGRSCRVSAPEGAAPVVAVLPFADGGGQDDLGSGMAEVLISNLAGVPRMNVLASPATFSYRSLNPDIRRVATDLGANYVVNGRLQRSGDALLLTLNLVRGDTQVVAWSETFRGHVGGVFELQEEAATALAAALRVRLSERERQRFQATGTQSAEALAEYSRARVLLERPDVAGNIEQALTLFGKAIARDPRFALAHAGLGQAYWEKYRALKDVALAAAAKDATAEALRLEPEQPLVRYSLAVIYRGTGKVAEAREELERLLRAQPGNDEAHRLLGKILVDGGSVDEGLTHLRTAVELRPAFGANVSDLGMGYFRTGRFADAAASFRRLTELQPDNATAHQRLGSTYAAMGDRDKARASYEAALRIAPDTLTWANLGTLHFEAGNLEEAQRAFEGAARLDPRSAIAQRNVGDVHARRGRGGEARAAWERAAELCRVALTVNPKDAESLSLLGVLEAKLGRTALARTHAQEAMNLSPQAGHVLHRVGVVQALTGKPDDAVATLRQALARGYSVGFIRNDRDLDSLRSRPDFAALIDSPPPRGNF
jgi:serine/threonine-protein kinase